MSPTICLCSMKGCGEQIGGLRPGESAKCPTYCGSCSRLAKKEKDDKNQVSGDELRSDSAGD